jgi:hypothetical protein
MGTHSGILNQVRRVRPFPSVASLGLGPRCSPSAFLQGSYRSRVVRVGLPQLSDVYALPKPAPELGSRRGVDHAESERAEFDR